MSDKMHEFMEFQINRAHGYYDEANKGIPKLERKSQFAIYSSSKIYHGILRKIEARGHNPFEGRVFVPQIKKIGILIQQIIKTRFVPSFFKTSQFSIKKYKFAKTAV